MLSGGRILGRTIRTFSPSDHCYGAPSSMAASTPSIILRGFGKRTLYAMPIVTHRGSLPKMVWRSGPAPRPPSLGVPLAPSMAHKLLAPYPKDACYGACHSNKQKMGSLLGLWESHGAHAAGACLQLWSVPWDERTLDPSHTNR